MPPLFSEPELRNARRLVEAALSEDLSDRGDLTTTAVIPESAQGSVAIVARKAGVISGLPIAPLVFESIDPAVDVQPRAHDGDQVRAGAVIAELRGLTRSLLIGERTVLNFLTHLSGIATLTHHFVERVAGTRALILDTRKTLPGWRALAKYAVRCGGGTNHRFGLYDGVLIKDNHLAAWSDLATRPSIAEAVTRARETSPQGIPIQVEVDSLDQLRIVLAARPDMVLLDNMPPPVLHEAVSIRNKLAPNVLLEASGGVSLETVTDIARAGVDRISIGALTHSAPALDIAFDWNAE